MTDLGSPSNQARKRLRVDQNYNSVTMSHQNGVNSAKSSVNGSDSSSAAGSENDEFTDGDFDDSDGEVTICAKADDSKGIPCNEAVNPHMFPGLTNGGVQLRDKSKMNSLAPKIPPENNSIFNENNAIISNEDLSIIGILGKDHDRAEARLAARRAARAEAREIRMRELERQQKEQEENADRVYDMYSDSTTRVARVASRVVSSAPSSGNYHSSRRSSEDSVEEMGSIRDIRHELKEVEEKFRKAMILNAQLDNDKASFSYQLELLKDKLEDLQEQYTQLQREHKDKCRAFDSLTRECRATREELERCTAAVLLRDRCIREAGLELVAVEGDPGEGAGAALVSSAGREALEQAGQGTLDVRLQTLCSERQTLENEVKQLKAQLEEERSRKKSTLHNSSNGPVNGSDSDSDSFDHQRENSKLVADYKFRACKAEQDVLTLQATVARLDSQVLRYRSAAEQAERMEDELKSDRRKLQREAREALSRVEELETENSHLNKRLDKLKTAKSALLKEL